MNLQKETKSYQDLLGSYCKTGKNVTIPGVTKGRIHHYRRLVYNVVKGTMDQAYPIASSALGEEVWNQLVDDFFTNYDPSSPQLWKLPGEFYEYHSESGTSEELAAPYLDDLLFFEWSEIEVHTMPDIDPGPFSSEGDFILHGLVLNPEHQILQLEYPVHKTPVRDLDGKKGLYYVLVFREPETGRVQFMDLSVVHAFVLMKISETGLPLKKFIADVASLAAVESEKYLIDYLSKFLQHLKERKMVLGFTS